MSSLELLNDVKSNFISDKSAPKKTEDKDEETASSELQQNYFHSKLDFVRGIAGDDDSNGRDSKERNTNEVDSSGTAATSAGQNVAYDNLEANIATTPLVINKESIANLKEMYPHNQAVGELQKSLTDVLNSGKKVEDLPDEVKDQLKLIFNPQHS